MPSFTEVMNKPVDQIEKPKPRPAGSYVGMVAGMPAVKNVKAKGEDREVLSFSIKLLSPHEVEDQEALAELPPVNTWPPQSHDFWDGEGGEYAAKMFLTATLDIEEKDAKGKAKTLGELAGEAPGKQLLVILENYPYQNKQGEQEIGTRIKSVAKL